MTRRGAFLFRAVTLCARGQTAEGAESFNEDRQKTFVPFASTFARFEVKPAGGLTCWLRDVFPLSGVPRIC